MILNQSQLKLIDIGSTDYSEVWTHASGTESSTQLPLKLTGFPLILGNKSQINDFHHSASHGESEVTLYNRAISKGLWHLAWSIGICCGLCFPPSTQGKEGGIAQSEQLSGRVVQTLLCLPP